jgi:Uma2 family endonuclease
MASLTAVTVPLVIDLDHFERVVLRPDAHFTCDRFVEFCQQHALLRIERNAEGEIIVMAPVGGEGSFLEFQVGLQLGIWAERDQRGIVLSPSLGVTLPDGSTVSPDACWVPNEMWQAVPRELRKKFPPLVPPFVIEIRSPTDRKKDLHEKVLAYLGNGVELGWLIDPLSRTIRIYKQSEKFLELNDPSHVEGEGPVAGFTLDLNRIYDRLDA